MIDYHGHPISVEPTYMAATSPTLSTPGSAVTLSLEVEWSEVN